MSQRNVVLSYVALMTLVSTTLGGYVACGAQSYRVPIHGTEGEFSGRKPAGPNSANGPANLTTGVHSSLGWKKNLPIKFRTSVDLPQPVVDELRRAMGTWESAVGKQLFLYEGTESRKGAEFKDLYEPLNDGMNGHYFDFNWAQATGKSSSVLATTIWENSAQDAQSIIKADIRYNAEFYIFGDALKDYSSGKRTIVDMESLSLHEVGHLLGLSHINEADDRYSVMNPSLFIGEGMMTRRLSEGDIERIRNIYGVGDPALADRLERADNFPQHN